MHRGIGKKVPSLHHDGFRDDAGKCSFDRSQFTRTSLEKMLLLRAQAAKESVGAAVEGDSDSSQRQESKVKEALEDILGNYFSPDDKTKALFSIARKVWHFYIDFTSRLLLLPRNLK